MEIVFIVGMSAFLLGLLPFVIYEKVSKRSEKVRYWNRFCATCGSEKSALRVLEAAEFTHVDYRISRGFRSIEDELRMH